MDIETVSPNYEDIRPLNPDEFPVAIEELLASEEFRKAIHYIKPNLNWDELAAAYASSSSKLSFWTRMCT